MTYDLADPDLIWYGIERLMQFTTSSIYCQFARFAVFYKVSAIAILLIKPS